MRVILCNPEEAKSLGHKPAMVLSQIRYWLFKANKGQNRYVVERGGKRYVAHSREQLCNETGLSTKQMRIALEILRKSRMIDVEQHLYYGKNVSHFQAAKEGSLEKAQKTLTGLAQDGHTEQDQSGNPEMAQMGHLNIDAETISENEREYGAQSALALSGGKIKKENTGENGKGIVTSNEVDTSQLPLAKRTPTEVGQIFRKAWDASYPDDYFAPFTAKQLNQLGTSNNPSTYRV